MAIDSYIAFQQYSSGGAWLDSESQVDFSKINQPLMDTPSKLTQGKIFEIDDFSFDIEQTLNIGSQASGAGAGKVTFNPFSITRKTDRASPLLFEMACSGTPVSRPSSCAGQERRRSDHCRRQFRKPDFSPSISTSNGPCRSQDDFLGHDDDSRRNRVTFERRPAGPLPPAWYPTGKPLAAPTPRAAEPRAESSRTLPPVPTPLAATWTEAPALGRISPRPKPPHFENVSQERISPLLRPAVSHCWRNAEEPWVKLSGTA